jgi:NAD-dependent dihydropyrimidine dehydrogenase PreA subunit
MIYLKNVVSLRLDPGLCTGCGRCLEVCPRCVFALEGKKAVVTELDNCLECGACERNCAFGAITVSAGVGCAAALIRSYFDSSREPTCGCGEESCCG